MTNRAKWFKPFARAGYASRGLIYAVIGFFSGLAAIGAGRPMDSRQALDALLSSSVGSWMTYALVVGLFCYATWRLIQGGFDTDGHGNGPKGLAVRGGLLVSSMVYVTLAFYALSLRIGGTDRSDDGFAQNLNTVVGSRWAAAVIAAALAAVAIGHFTKALREKYADHLQASAKAMRLIHPVAKFGLIARGCIFLTVAFLFALRSFYADPDSTALNSRDALEYIQSLPAGQYLLAGTGVGLLSFALYSFAEAAFRRINVEDVLPTTQSAQRVGER